MDEERDPVSSPGSRSRSSDGASAPVLLEVVDLSKSYGPVRAVRGLSLDIRVGEVHAVCGHNGAGKSTLVKALVGLVRPDEGVIRFDGSELTLRNPHEAQAHGIALVNQELSLVPELSVEDNIFLGGIDVPLVYRRRRLSDHARSVLDQLGLRHVQLGTPVETLSIGERQLVEIARLLVREMLEAGAHGFVEKTAGLVEFKKGLQSPRLFQLDCVFEVQSSRTRASERRCSDEFRSFGIIRIEAARRGQGTLLIIRVFVHDVLPNGV